jgi:hypothetical protein
MALLFFALETASAHHLNATIPYYKISCVETSLQYFFRANRGISQVMMLKAQLHLQDPCSIGYFSS